MTHDSSTIRSISRPIPGLDSYFTRIRMCAPSYSSIPIAS